MADNSVEYALVRVSRPVFERLRDSLESSPGALPANLASRPVYCCAEGGDCDVYPPMSSGHIDIRADGVFYVPTPKADAMRDFLRYAAPHAAKDYGLAEPAAAQQKAIPSVWVKVFDEASRGVAAAQRKEHPAQTGKCGDPLCACSAIPAMPEPNLPEPGDVDFTDDFPCGICGQRGLHACAPPPAPTIFNRIVSMVEFKGRLYVATETSVFVKRDNEDAFDQCEIYHASPAMGGLTGAGNFNVPTPWGPCGADCITPTGCHAAGGCMRPPQGRAADAGAGLVPLHPRQTAERADPFVPNRFGEHG